MDYRGEAMDVEELSSQGQRQTRRGESGGSHVHKKHRRRRSDDTSHDDSISRHRTRHSKHTERSKRNRSPSLSSFDSDLSSCSEDSSFSSDTSPVRKKGKRELKRLKKKKKELKKMSKKTKKDLKRRKKRHKHRLKVGESETKSGSLVPMNIDDEAVKPSAPPLDVINLAIAGSSVKPRGPMTREDYERQQSVVRRVYDPDTGRYRLVKGDGEIIEEIVSKEQQKAINKQATLGDSMSFQAGLAKFQ